MNTDLPNTEDITKAASEQMVRQWRADKTKHGAGRHTCPCGYHGWSKNIINHRTKCPVWQIHVKLPG